MFERNFFFFVLFLQHLFMHTFVSLIEFYQDEKKTVFLFLYYEYTSRVDIDWIMNKNVILIEVGKKNRNNGIEKRKNRKRN